MLDIKGGVMLGQGFSEEELSVVKYQAGEIIIMEGETPDGLYLLEWGEIEVLKGDEVLSTIKESGSFFGEMSYLINQKRTATLKAKTDVSAYRITSTDNFNELIQKVPEKMFSLLETMALRLDFANRQLEDKKRYQRLVELVTDIAGAEGRDDIVEFIDDHKKTLDFVDQERNYELMSQFLMTPRIWTSLRDVTCSVIHQNTAENPTMDTYDILDPGELDFSWASQISFDGDIKGSMLMHLDQDYAKFMAEKMGITLEDISEGEICNEIASQVLGTLKGSITTFKIEITAPKRLFGKDALLDYLGDIPTLKLSYTSEHGHFQLLFQIESINKET